jgi:hypothetical protein
MPIETCAPKTGETVKTVAAITVMMTKRFMPTHLANNAPKAPETLQAVLFQTVKLLLRLCQLKFVAPMEDTEVWNFS